MLFVRLALRSSNSRVQSCTTCKRNCHSFEHAKKLTSNESKKLNFKALETITNDDSISSPAFRPSNFYSTFTRQSLQLRNNEKSNKLQFQSCRNFATDEAAPKDKNVFGSLNNQKYDEFEMDEDEKAEEKFVENEGPIHRRYKLTPGGYAKLIKSHIRKGDLDAALEVLKLVKENKDEATPYMYNLLLRAFAVAGDFKQCRSLYVTMKKRGLKCNDATYTSIINACAEYHHTETALDYLADLRQEFIQKNIPLNETHYNAMIKAYGRHGNVIEAFKLADEMRDKRLPTSDITFNSLLIGAISDYDAGLRHSIIIWHQMRRHQIKPTINTYNLLLRAIRDTKLRDLKVNDILIPDSAETQIILNDDAPPNLLKRFPSINSLVVTRMQSKEEEEREVEIDEDEKSERIESFQENLPATTNSVKDEKSLALMQKKILDYPLEKIHRQNRLILFGGVTGILESMEKDEVVPDVKTMTLLMELVPTSKTAENTLVKMARSKGIRLDIDFYNMLMKKRSIRKDYVGAKLILDDIQRSGLCPDIITWGVLAMGCQTSEEARELIDGMKLTGHRLNPVIAGTLINIACKKIRFGYILEMMETMKSHHVKPNWELYATLDAFQTEMEMMIKSKKFSRTVNHPAFKTGFSKFNCRYVSWQEEMGRNKSNAKGSNDGKRSEKKIRYNSRSPQNVA